MTVENTVSTDRPQTDLAAAEETHGVELTETAAVKARTLLEQEGRDDMHLRIAVQPGGCAGLRYQLFFDDRELDGDLFRDFSGLRVGVDRMSAPYRRAGARWWAVRDPGRDGSVTIGAPAVHHPVG